MKLTRLVLDALDQRALPSASLVNGVLLIDGTEGRDIIVLRQVRDQISVRGQLIDLDGIMVKSVPAASVTQVAVSTGAGDDFINLATVKVPTSVNAGEGKDMVLGGTKDDQIFGGEGSDRLAGLNGNDVIFGGTEDDRLVGGRGNDQLYGEEGNDQAFGQQGDDDCDGGAGNDLIVGGIGNDHNLGGDGVNVIHDGHAYDPNNHVHQLVAGVITALDLTASTITVQTQHGDLVVVNVAPDTVLTRNLNPATLDTLQVGDWLLAKFDANGTTLRVDAMTRHDGAGVDSHLSFVVGMVTAINLADSVVTIQTHDGTFQNLSISPNTILTRNAHHVTLADFTVGDLANATVDEHGATLRIDAITHVIDNGHTSVEGVISAIDLHLSVVAIQTPDGMHHLVLINQHTELVRNQQPATLDAFHIGDHVKVTFDENRMTIRFETIDV
jgi:Ca2+-binding RTX toxin-like protein